MLRGLNTEVGFTAPQLKPCFHLFQRVWDQLYLTLPSLEEHTSLSAVYLGALGFTKPLEKLVLHAVPLRSLLEWLLKPKGPHLVEALAATAPERPWCWPRLNICSMGRTLRLWEWGLCISLTTFPQSPSAPPTCICMCGMLRAPVRIRWTS